MLGMMPSKLCMTSFKFFALELSFTLKFRANVEPKIDELCLKLKEHFSDKNEFISNSLYGDSHETAILNKIHRHQR